MKTWKLILVLLLGGMLTSCCKKEIDPRFDQKACADLIYGIAAKVTGGHYEWAGCDRLR